MDAGAATRTLPQTATNQTPSQDKIQSSTAHNRPTEKTVRTSKAPQTDRPDNLNSDEMIKTILSTASRTKLERDTVMSDHHKDKVFYHDIIKTTAALDEVIAQYKQSDAVKKEALSTRLLRRAVDYQQALNSAYRELGLTRK